MVLAEDYQDYAVLARESDSLDFHSRRVEMRLLKRLIRDDSGAVATEYVVITGLIAVALIAVIVGFRDSIADVINDMSKKTSKDAKKVEPTEGQTPVD